MKAFIGRVANMAYQNYGLLVFKYEGRDGILMNLMIFLNESFFGLLCFLRPGPKAACGWLRAANGELHSTWR